MHKRVSAPHFSDVISITKPEPDSHFRLVPCRCGSDNIAYVKFVTPMGDSYRVSCFDCGCTMTPSGIVSKHTAQMHWNGIKEAVHA